MSNFITVNAYLHRERRNGGSLRVSQVGDDRRGVWVGRKWIRDNGFTGASVIGRDMLGLPKRVQEITLTIPRWLAKEAGLRQ
jgi:hypothetical protein